MFDDNCTNNGDDCVIVSDVDNDMREETQE